MLHAILQIRGWCEYGYQNAVVEEEEEEFEGRHRIELMVREDVKKEIRLNEEGLMFWVRSIVGEMVFRELVGEIEEELNGFIKVSSY